MPDISACHCSAASALSPFGVFASSPRSCFRLRIMACGIMFAYFAEACSPISALFDSTLRPPCNDDLDCSPGTLCFEVDGAVLGAGMCDTDLDGNKTADLFDAGYCVCNSTMDGYLDCGDKEIPDHFAVAGVIVAPCVQLDRFKCDELRCPPQTACAEGTFGAVCRRVDGEGCRDGRECTSGVCVEEDEAGEGVCCATACDKPCQSCRSAHTGQPTGTCNAIRPKTDPYSECEAADVSTCGNNGTGCNGDAQQPGCRLYAAGLECASSTCETGQEQLGGACDGVGACLSNGVKYCAPFACGAARCNTSCESNAQCADGYTCSNNICV